MNPRQQNNHLKDKDILESIKSVLEIEQESIGRVKDKLDITFLKAIKLILNCKGTLILSGLGKSGLISKKISATFSSLGTPSTYIHPGDALHGDLGLIKKEDVVLMVSYSGETEELIRLQLYLENQGNLSIIISGNKESSLSKLCSVFIDGHVKKEACYHNLAPTSSTTVAIAIGDALAVTISKIKNFKKSDFIKNHPSGYLGKLYITKIKDVMVKENLPVCKKNTNIMDVISLITKGCLGVALILDNSNRLIGIITDGDLRRALQDRIDLGDKVYKIMNRKPITISADKNLIDASELMQSSKVAILPVTQNEKIIGAIQLINCK